MQRERHPGNPRLQAGEDAMCTDCYPPAGDPDPFAHHKPVVDDRQGDLFGPGEHGILAPGRGGYPPAHTESCDKGIRCGHTWRFARDDYRPTRDNVA